MTVEQLQQIFLSDRPSMKENNQNPYHLLNLLRGEMTEFAEALIYWIVDPTEKSLQELGQEAADLGLYIQAILSIAGLSLDEEMRDKVAYNTIRFKPGYFKALPYKEAYKLSKSDVIDEGTKSEFYSIPKQGVIYDQRAV